MPAELFEKYRKLLGTVSQAMKYCEANPELLKDIDVMNTFVLLGSCYNIISEKMMAAKEEELADENAIRAANGLPPRDIFAS